MNYRNIPVPRDLTKITAVCQENNGGMRWLKGIQPGTIVLDEENEYLTFVVRWSNGQLRRYSISLDYIAGYEESA